MAKTVIKIENLSKIYRLGEIGTGTLSHDLNRWWKMNVMRKEDPFAKVGQVNDRTAKAKKGELVAALSNINLEVKQGEILGIIGRNGAGKSTLLKILSRVTSPTTGTIKTLGRMASLLEVGTGFHPEMTGRENIYMNGTIMGMRKWEIDKQLDAIVDFAGIAKYLDTPVKRYSSGMTVRLGFSIAAHLEPEILVVDEVLAVGDAEFQKKAIGKMQDVSKNEGRTVLFVSHNMGSIQKLCKTGILMNQGIITHNDSITTVVNNYLNIRGLEDYSCSAQSTNKVNFFTKIYTQNNSFDKTNNFNFNENINISFEFEINEYFGSLKIGIGLQDKNKNRVFTVLKTINNFRIENSSNKYKGRLIIPSCIIAPNNYSFVAAIWSKETTVYDSVEDICSIKIHDNGTELSDYEGYDYGSIFIKTEWFND
jgi:lipopolysaccharide transport system ATP-binding protein